MTTILGNDIHNVPNEGLSWSLWMDNEREGLIDSLNLSSLNFQWKIEKLLPLMLSWKIWDNISPKIREWVDQIEVKDGIDICINFRELRKADLFPDSQTSMWELIKQSPYNFYKWNPIEIGSYIVRHIKEELKKYIWEDFYFILLTPNRFRFDGATNLYDPWYQLWKPYVGTKEDCKKHVKNIISMWYTNVRWYASEYNIV